MNFHGLQPRHLEQLLEALPDHLVFVDTERRIREREMLAEASTG